MYYFHAIFFVLSRTARVIVYYNVVVTRPADVPLHVIASVRVTAPVLYAMLLLRVYDTYRSTTTVFHRRRR